MHSLATLLIAQKIQRARWRKSRRLFAVSDQDFPQIESNSRRMQEVVTAPKTSVTHALARHPKKSVAKEKENKKSESFSPFAPWGGRFFISPRGAVKLELNKVAQISAHAGADELFRPTRLWRISNLWVNNIDRRVCFMATARMTQLTAPKPACSCNKTKGDDFYMHFVSSWFI